MEMIDVRDEQLKEVEINGKIALFTELRVDKGTIPHGVFCYELRHGDDDSYPATMEIVVNVKYFGAVFSMEQLLEDESVEVGYDNFGFTGEEKQIYELMGREPEVLKDGSELVTFIVKNGLDFHVTMEEADMLLGYMEGHDYCVGQMDGCLYRGDKANNEERIVWSGYSVDDLIDCICEWNYELILDTDAERQNPKDFIDFANKQNYYEKLRSDEQVLDRLFEQTKYSIQINQLAEQLANEFIARLKPETIEAATVELASQIRQVSGGGRAR